MNIQDTNRDSCASAFTKDFLSNGFIKFDVEELNSLQKINYAIREIMSNVFPDNFLRLSRSSDDVFADLHKEIKVEEVNSLRLSVYNDINALSWFREEFYKLVSMRLLNLVGDELAWQNKVNFSIMMPGDDSSNIPIHRDFHSGESLFQVVVWVPLTDAFGKNSMFIEDLSKPRVTEKQYLKWMTGGGNDNVMKNIGDRIRWIDVKYGEALIFSPNLLHGSIPNGEKKTRCSLNLRFKSLFSPYYSTEKSIGVFYSPMKLKPVTEFALRYMSDI